MEEEEILKQRGLDSDSVFVVAESTKLKEIKLFLGPCD